MPMHAGGTDGHAHVIGTRQAQRELLGALTPTPLAVRRMGGAAGSTEMAGGMMAGGAVGAKRPRGRRVPLWASACPRCGLHVGNPGKGQDSNINYMG